MRGRRNEWSNVQGAVQGKGVWFGVGTLTVIGAVAGWQQVGGVHEAVCLGQGAHNVLHRDHTEVAIHVLFPHCMCQCLRQYTGCGVVQHVYMSVCIAWRHI